jgi:hypothetical protein
LQLEFHSLDAQREAGVASIANQPYEGWTCLPHRNEKGSFCWRRAADNTDGRLHHFMSMLIFSLDAAGLLARI